MIDIGDGTVLKCLQNPPRGTVELNFYEKVFNQTCSDPDYEELKPFLPPFFGSEEINGSKYEINKLKLLVPFSLCS